MAATPKQNKPRTKSRPEKKPGELVPQPHGGALQQGGTNPGSGRPASEIRAQMRGSLAKRIRIAEKIADNPKSSDSDRLRALDFLAKYGMGTKSEVTGEDGAPLQAGVVILPAVRPDANA